MKGLVHLSRPHQIFIEVFSIIVLHQIGCPCVFEHIETHVLRFFREHNSRKPKKKNQFEPGDAFKSVPELCTYTFCLLVVLVS